MTQEARKLKNKCKVLIERRIFRYLPCVFCKSMNKLNTWKIERAHIIRRSDFTKYKFHIMNILPLCAEHHGWLHDTKEVEATFMYWLEQNLPLHFAWYEQHLNERPQTIPISYWEGLHRELKFYANHPAEAYRVIFENI